MSGTWLSFDAASRIFSGTPLNGDVGDTNVRVVVSDSITTVSDDFISQVTNTNDAPTGSDTAAGLLGDQSTFTISSEYLSGSISDVDLNDTLTITDISVSGGGTVSETSTDSGIWIYTPPDVSSDTSITLTYTIEDSARASASANISLTVVEGVPFGSINEDNTSSVLSFSNYTVTLANSEQSKGTLLNDIFTPTDNFNGEVIFTLTNNSDSSILPGFLSVLPVNDAPTTSNVTLTAITEDSGALTITNAQLISAAVDQESDTLTVSNVAIASGSGALVDNSNGTWSYTPATNDETSVSFSYTITDDGTTNGSADPLPVEGTATLDITAVNNAPTDVDITATTNEDVPFNFQTDSFSFSDPIGNNDFAGLVIASLPTAGTLKLSGSSVSVGQSISSGDISNLVFIPATKSIWH